MLFLVQQSLLRSYYHIPQSQTLVSDTGETTDVENKSPPPKYHRKTLTHTVL